MNDKLIKFLLVEDNPDHARMVQEYLDKSDAFRFELVHVELLIQALIRLSKDSFDVIILDLNLPDCRGLPP